MILDTAHFNSIILSKFAPQTDQTHSLTHSNSHLSKITETLVTLLKRTC